MLRMFLFLKIFVQSSLNSFSRFIYECYLDKGIQVKPGFKFYRKPSINTDAR